MILGKCLWALKQYVFNANYRFMVNTGLGLYNHMSDADFLHKKYKLSMGTELDLDNPKTFNEKIQWLKLNDRRPEYTVMVDKHLVKEYVGSRIGEEHIIPTIGAWSNPSEIIFDELPSEFVLKCNHNSGLGMCICKDKTKLNISHVKRRLCKGLAEDYFLSGREWPYKNVERKIIAEQFMKNGDEGLTDYKIHCFNGEPKLILVCKDRFSDSGLTEDFYSVNWEHLDLKRPNISQAKNNEARPDALEEMLNYARILSKGIPFLRVDFYIINGHVFFGELTFFPAGGFKGFEPDSWDDIMGGWLNLDGNG